MNILNKVTFQYLLRNRTRTIVSIIGVILSTALVTALTTLTSSVFQCINEYYMYEEGNWHGSQLDISLDQYNEIKEDSEVDAITYIQKIGVAKDDGLDNYSKPYLGIYGIGKESDDLLPIHLTSGHYPTTTSEIILPENIISSGSGSYQIGDSFTLDLGTRMLNGSTLAMNDSYTFDQTNGSESIQIEQTKTYQIVGFYERMGYTVDPYESASYPCLTLRDETNQNTTYDIFYRIKNVHKITDFNQRHHITGTTNKRLLNSYGVIGNNNFKTAFLGLTTIILLLIIIGSIALIYNAFSISVSERTKQFGLLSSIGATKKQLKHMVIVESLFISLVGIPLGILIGILGIGITLVSISERLIQLGLPISMHFSVSLLSIVFSIIISLLTILISAYIPSNRATKVSAIEAIKQTHDIQLSAKNVRTSKLSKKLFGLPGILANKYYKRNKKKYRTTIFSLCISIVLFVSATSFTDYLTYAAVTSLQGSSYDIFYSSYEDCDLETITNLLSQASDVTNQQYKVSELAIIQIPRNNIQDASKSTFEDMLDSSIQNDPNTYKAYANVEFVDDDTFKSLLKDNNLKEEDYYNTSQITALAVDTYSYYGDDDRYHTGNYLNNKLDDIEFTIYKEIPDYYFSEMIQQDDGTSAYLFKSMDDDSNEEDILLSENEAFKNTTISVGKVLTEHPMFAIYSSNLTYILPISLREYLVPNDSKPMNPSIYFTSSNHTKTYNEMKKILQANKLDTIGLFDYAETQEQNRNMIFIGKVFAYGFIIIISLIAATNVFNTITTNINLRRREFAMLKSIGMEQKSFYKIMNYECLLYGFKALIYGLPASLLVSYLLYSFLLDGIDMEFIIPYKAMFIATLSVFIVVFLSMLYSMNKIKKDNVIDTLRNENI